MIYLECDYMVGGHPEVMARLNETNMIHTSGYGNDEFTEEACKTVLEACGLDDGAVYFFAGGTQTNMVVLDRLLDKNDGVIAAETAHINVHEAGAIEACGHKILCVPSSDGKLSAESIRKYMKDFYGDDTNVYMVRPAAVYITFSTELGTIYKKKELEEIADVCHEYNIPLYIDGARMAYGIAASNGDVTLNDIARIADVFYIGGTKCGALFGEAVVTGNKNLLPRFDSLMKLRGATLAKGRLVAIQFETLLKDGLYHEIGEHAVEMAKMLKSGFLAKGYKTFIDSPSNQQFFILPNQVIDLLSKECRFELWGPKCEKESNVRFVTDWTTSKEDIEHLIDIIPEASLL